jgi:hypothetical protein
MTTTTDSTIRDGSFVLHLDGYPDCSTLDLTLADVELAEEVCGVPYLMLNPLASAREAKALLVVLLVRNGVEQDAALEQAGKLPLRKLAGAFTYVPPERLVPAAIAEAGDPPR